MTFSRLVVILKSIKQIRMGHNYIILLICEMFFFSKRQVCLTANEFEIEQWIKISLPCVEFNLETVSANVCGAQNFRTFAEEIRTLQR